MDEGIRQTIEAQDAIDEAYSVVSDLEEMEGKRGSKSTKEAISAAKRTALDAVRIANLAINAYSDNAQIWAGIAKAKDLVKLAKAQAKVAKLTAKTR